MATDAPSASPAAPPPPATATTSASEVMRRCTAGMSEAQEQAAVVEYCELRGIPVYHIPNEGRRSPRGGAALRRQGLRAGVPDLCVPVARGRYHSLYIEMKAGGGKVSPAQAEWITLLRSHGMCAAVCYGSRNAAALIDRYMALGEPPSPPSAT